MLIPQLFLAGCRSNQDEDALHGRVTLWHSWPASEAVVLQDAIAQFQEIHPDVRVITVSLPREQLLAEFQKAGKDGFGPALLIGNDTWIGALVEEGLIRPVVEYVASPVLLTSKNRALTSKQDRVFGVPLFLEPRALYFDKQQVSEVPESLDALLEEAAQGKRVAFVPRFEEAYWGIQAFGNGLFDEEGRFTLADSGFEEWLSWLEKAQQEPGVIINEDDQSLLDLFTNGEIAYYVAGPDKQNLMTDMVDEDAHFTFGVQPLPGGPNGASGPLLTAETMMLYAFSSTQQNRTAAALATFLANQQQGIRFMREIKRVPANPGIAIDPRLYPVPNGFARQARTAVVLPNEIPIDPFVAAGNRAYTSVLSGLLSPDEAVCRFGQEVVTLMGYAAGDVDFPEGCEFPEN
jgi:maltose-binding protein MalE